MELPADYEVCPVGARNMRVDSQRLHLLCREVLHMTQHSEERVAAPAEIPSAKSARILPFERPPSELQRAIQQRAQEAMERDRDREKIRPAWWRWAVVLMLAIVPVFLIFGAVDGFLRAFYRYNEIFSTPAPSAEPTPQQSSQPGVVMLESFEAQTQGSAPTAQ